MGERTWDRIGAAAGVVGVALGFLGLGLGGGAGGFTAAAAARPAFDATSDEIVRWMTQTPLPSASAGNAVLRTAMVLLLLFLARLWATVRRGEGGTGWLSAAGLAGGVAYVVVSWSGYITSEARNIAGGHMGPPEALTMFDMWNAVAQVKWITIAMLLLPNSIVAIRTRALPGWLGWAGLLIGAANLVYGWVPPVGVATPAEAAALAWLVATGIVLWRRPLAPTP